MKLLLVLFLFEALVSFHGGQSFPTELGSSGPNETGSSSLISIHRKVLGHHEKLLRKLLGSSSVKRGFFEKVKDFGKKAKKTKDSVKALPKSAKDAAKAGAKRAGKKVKDKRSKGKKRVKRGFFDKVKDFAKKAKKSAKNTKDAVKTVAKVTKDAVKDRVKKLMKKKFKGGKRNKRSSDAATATTTDILGSPPPTGLQVVRQVIRQGQENQGAITKICCRAATAFCAAVCGINILDEKVFEKFQLQLHLSGNLYPSGRAHGPPDAQVSQPPLRSLRVSGAAANSSHSYWSAGRSRDR